MVTYNNPPVAKMNEAQVKELCGIHYDPLVSLLYGLKERQRQKRRPWRYNEAEIAYQKKDIGILFSMCDAAGVPWTLQNKIISISGVNGDC